MRYCCTSRAGTDSIAYIIGATPVSHVPCKFYGAGHCVAGSSCRFLHSLDVNVRINPCTWFAKGNCKFAEKCALAHILPETPLIRAMSSESDMILVSSDDDEAAAPSANPLEFVFRKEESTPAPRLRWDHFRCHRFCCNT